jgi:hypothetical protein
MIRKDEEAAVAYLRNCLTISKQLVHHLAGGQRTPVSAFDYGDEQTVLLFLKRVDYEFDSGDIENSFGVYLGNHNDGYVVGIKKFLGDGLNACEVFDSIDEMKRYWRLD